MHHWKFVWDQDKEMSLSEKAITGWKMSRANTEPTLEAWIMAHDVLHHAPEDTGTFEEEIRSFGAELWFTEKFIPSATLENVFSILEKTAEYFPLNKLILKDSFSPFIPRNQEEATIYQESIEMIGSDLNVFTEDRISSYDQEDQAVLKQINSPENIEKYAQTVILGYRKAEERWPNKEHAVSVFQSLVESFKPFQSRANEMGETILIERLGNQLNVDFYPTNRLYELEEKKPSSKPRINKAPSP